MTLALALEHSRLATRALEALVPTPPAPAPAPRGLAKPAEFYAVLKVTAPFGPTLTQAEVDGCNRILKACEGLPTSHAAYVVGTVFHETAGTMAPIREIGRGAGRKYGSEDPPGSGRVYYGRGYVQLTWLSGYAKAEAELGVPFVEQPDLALEEGHASAILRRGMEAGWFTGKKMADYLPPFATKAEFTSARRIVNGTDRAELIASYAVNIQTALNKGGWA